jgi:hypothetical protein
MPIAASFYTVALAVHIIGVVIAFGVTFVYPVVIPVMRRNDPRTVAGIHRMQEQIGKRVISPALVVVLLAGIYLASKLDVWSSFYVQWGFGVVIVLGALGGAYFGPREGRLAAMAERDIAAAADGGQVVFSAEYEALHRQVMIVNLLANVLVLATIYVMTAQTGA